MSRKTSKTGKVQSKKSMSVTSNGTFVRKNRAQYSENTWVVFTTDNGKMKAPRTFDSKLTRDNVRNAYAREFGIKMQDTRSRRVSNVK